MTAETCWTLFWATGVPECYALYREFMEATTASV